ncbi:hypothetical protein ACHAXT_008739 [Thalassiosira profunda]
MARRAFCQIGALGALALGALASVWAAAVSIALSTTLSERELEMVEEAAILPNIVRARPSLQRDAASDAPSGVHRPTIQNQDEMTRRRRRRRYGDTNAVHYHPRTIYSDGTPLSDDEHKSKKERHIHIERNVLKNREHIKNDANYLSDEASPSREECVPMAEWQSHSYPNCNYIHEVDMQRKTYTGEFFLVASGGFNDVFRVDDEITLALKILRPGKKHLPGVPNKWDYTTGNYDIVRRDALVSERLTSSSHVLPIYSYCGFSEVVPWADGGTLPDALQSQWSRGVKDWKNITSAVRLKYAVDAAAALADLHYLGVVHADLTVKQYMIGDGRLQLGDFNRGIFLERNATAPDTACTFQMTDNYGTTRAPEEYKHEPQTIAVDVWSLGSIIFHLLTGRKVWDKTKKNEAQEAVVGGLLPEIDATIVNASDPVNGVLMKALDMCWVYEPSKRATAREVASFLQESWHKQRSSSEV